MWEGIEVIVDMECTMEQLERVATEVVAVIKSNPRWYGGYYKVGFAESVSGWKQKVAVWFDYNDPGALVMTPPLHSQQLCVAPFVA